MYYTARLVVISLDISDDIKYFNIELDIGNINHCHNTTRNSGIYPYFVHYMQGWCHLAILSNIFTKSDLTIFNIDVDN